MNTQDTLISNSKKKLSPDAIAKGTVLFEIEACEALPEGFTFSVGEDDGCDLNQLMTFMLTAQMMGLSTAAKDMLQAMFDKLKSDPSLKMTMNFSGEVVPYKAKSVMSEALTAKLQALKGTTPTTQTAKPTESLASQIFG